LTSVAVAGAAADGRQRVGARRKAGAVLALLLVLATVIQLAHVDRYRRISPVDELQHLDYLVRAPRGDVPGAGDLVLPESGRIQTCARIDDVFDSVMQMCAASNDEVDVSKLQEAGYNTAYIHPPTYYAVDGVLARLIDWVVPGNQSLLTTGRAAGLIWVWAAVVMMWLLFAEVGAGLLVRSALVVVVVSAPTVVHAAATINPDGTSIALGAAAIWLALRWERGRAPAWTLALIGALAAGTKVTNLLGVGLAAAYMAWPLVASAVDRRRDRSAGTVAAPGGGPSPAAAEQEALPTRSARDRLVALAWLLGSAVVVAGAWAIAQRALQAIPPSQVPMVARFRTTQFPLSQLTVSWRQTLSPLRSPYLPPFLRTSFVQTMADLVDLALIAGVVGGAILAAPRSRERRLAGAVLVMLAVIGPALVVFNFVVQGLYVDIPPRYGIALVPAMAAAAVPVTRRQFGRVVLVALAGASLAALGLALAFPAAA
jgi:hypothetical protein